MYGRLRVAGRRAVQVAVAATATTAPAYYCSKAESPDVSPGYSGEDAYQRLASHGFHLTAIPKGKVEPAPGDRGKAVPALEVERAAVGSTPHDRPLAGITEGAATDKVESPEKDKHDETKMTFPRYPGSSKLPAITCGKTTLPAVPLPAAHHIKNELAKAGKGAGGWFSKDGRPGPVKHVCEIRTTARTIQLSPSIKYPAWTFDDGVPGPVIRGRVGDWFEVRYMNDDNTGNGHNIDFHAVLGPGGGAPATYAEAGEGKSGLFKLTIPGVYIYHCAAAPLPAHVANGMYGIIIVDPPDGPLPSPMTLLTQEDLYGPGGKPASGAAKGSGGPSILKDLPPAPLTTPDGRPLREFAVVQSDFYGSDDTDDSGLCSFDYKAGLDEIPSHIVFNGREGALTEKPLVVQQGDRVRIYFGNGGPNVASNLHIIGTIFDAVWRDGDFISPPARGLQTVNVPCGGSVVVEFDAVVPGSLTIVDHALFRVDKGGVAFIKVLATPGGPGKREDLYASAEPPVFCPGCKLHN